MCELHATYAGIFLVGERGHFVPPENGFSPLNYALMYQLTGALDKQLCWIQQLTKVLLPLFLKDLICPPLNLFSRKIPAYV